MQERQIKKNLKSLLADDDLDHTLRATADYPLKKTISTLMAELYNTDEKKKWHAVSLMGELMHRLAREDMESARVMMRRILWNLNEESGGIGWGMVEAMGEILAINQDLAREYSNLLVSYMREENFLEHPVQQQGLMWALGRLGSIRPELLLKYDADGYLTTYLESPDLRVAGLACRNFGILGISEAAPHLEQFIDLEAQITLYENRSLFTTTVGQLARQALNRLQQEESIRTGSAADTRSS